MSAGLYIQDSQTFSYVWSSDVLRLFDLCSPLILRDNKAFFLTLKEPKAADALDETRRS